MSNAQTSQIASTGQPTSLFVICAWRTKVPNGLYKPRVFVAAHVSHQIYPAASGGVGMKDGEVTFSIGSQPPATLKVPSDCEWITVHEADSSGVAAKFV